MNDILTLIAKKHLNLETLDTRNSDELDFSDQSVWGIKTALQEAYQKGGQVWVRFARKPSDLHEVTAAARDDDAHADYVRILEHRRLSKTEYHQLVGNFMGNYDWMANKGGFTKGGDRTAIKITCPGEITLFIDPSGANYARYVGVEV